MLGLRYQRNKVATEGYTHRPTVAPARGGPGRPLKIKDFTFFVFITGLKVNFFSFGRKEEEGKSVRIKDVAPEMLKSHESGLVKVAACLHRAQWIEDPRGTRESFCRDPPGLENSRQASRTSLSGRYTHRVYIDRRYDGRVRAICLAEGLAKLQGTRLWDTSIPPDIINVDHSERIGILSHSFISSRIISDFIFFFNS